MDHFLTSRELGEVAHCTAVKLDALATHAKVTLQLEASVLNEDLPVLVRVDKGSPDPAPPGSARINSLSHHIHHMREFHPSHHGPNAVV